MKTILLSPKTKIKSNTLVVGNPTKVGKTNVFFTKKFLGYPRSEDSLNSQDYKSEVFIYEFVNKENLTINQIDKILKDLNVEDRLEFIQTFVRNKRKKRFTIK